MHTFLEYRQYHNNNYYVQEVLKMIQCKKLMMLHGEPL